MYWLWLLIQLIDQNGRGVIIIIGILMALVGVTAFHFATTLGGLVVGMVGISIAQAILFPMFIALQGDIATLENQTIITNLFVLFKYIGMVSGIVIGNIFGIEYAYMVVFFIIVIRSISMM